jgi:DNA-dependent protein kinase catalytic subunit
MQAHQFPSSQKDQLSTTGALVSGSQTRKAYNFDHNQYETNDDEIEIDMDDLNQHESLCTCVELIQSLVRNRLTPVYDKDQVPTEMPLWMQFFHRKISSLETHENVKLFLIRSIVNTQHVFKCYAKFWYTPLLSFLVNSTSLCTDGYIDYFTLDLVVLLLSWHKIGLPDVSAQGIFCVNEEKKITQLLYILFKQTDKTLIGILFEKLIQNCYHGNRAILKNNLELLKTMTECWKMFIHIPVDVIYSYLKSDDEKKLVTGIQLFGVVLSNNIESWRFPNHISSRE